MASDQGTAEQRCCGMPGTAFAGRAVQTECIEGPSARLRSAHQLHAVAQLGQQRLCPVHAASQVGGQEWATHLQGEAGAATTESGAEDPGHQA